MMFILGVIVGLLIAALNVLCYQKKVQENVSNKVEKLIKRNQMAEIVDMTEPLRDISQNNE